MVAHGVMRSRGHKSHCTQLLLHEEYYTSSVGNTRLEDAKVVSRFRHVSENFRKKTPSNVY